jgi:hypothetical protein
VSVCVNLHARSERQGYTRCRSITTGEAYICVLGVCACVMPFSHLCCLHISVVFRCTVTPKYMCVWVDIFATLPRPQLSPPPLPVSFGALAPSFTAIRVSAFEEWGTKNQRNTERTPLSPTQAHVYINIHTYSHTVQLAAPSNLVVAVIFCCCFSLSFLPFLLEKADGWSHSPPIVVAVSECVCLDRTCV